MSKIWVLQHAPSEPLGTIGAAISAAGISAHTIQTFKGQTVPIEIGDADGLIVMGGPMGVYDYPRYRFLRDEMRLIESALRAGKPILGVCLGCQLLAATLGAKVMPGAQKEIGWYEVTLAPEAAATDHLWRDVAPAFTAYHWHGDVFELPQGACALASSALTKYQAFRYWHNAYGLLFHMEVTAQIVVGMVSAFADELQAARRTPEEILSGGDTFLPPLQDIGQLVFQRWANLV